ncbi:MAG: D-tyrosyl-tRNA(Tyr) deacylase [Bacteroidales bacterium]|nr:D-tyrosyl-tRNA(Tyr) deacylase [Bacteroidales bacterium]
MRTVIQRVEFANVTINGKLKSEIGKGLLVLLGIEDEDTTGDIEWLCGKIARLRIFEDDKGLMNLSVNEVNGEILVVSQFTLHASVKKGNRPSFVRAAKPDKAIPLYHSFIQQLGTELNKEIKTGEFGAMMKVNLLNDGPVTLVVDTKNKE